VAAHDLDKHEPATRQVWTSDTPTIAGGPAAGQTGSSGPALINAWKGPSRPVTITITSPTNAYTFQTASTTGINLGTHGSMDGAPGVHIPHSDDTQGQFRDDP
jgi:hypothetical protein